MTDILTLEELVLELRERYPNITYIEDLEFKWDPKYSKIYYCAKDYTAIYSLLHETGHAVSGHKIFNSDVELLRMEIEAWDAAKHIAKGYSIKIPQEHVQKCLETYRNWLHDRSVCKNCDQATLQRDKFEFVCHNCSYVWNVSASQTDHH